ncbi:hypothetical protein D3C86_1904640 [compost metagenome]
MTECLPDILIRERLGHVLQSDLQQKLAFGVRHTFLDTRLPLESTTLAVVLNSAVVRRLCVQFVVGQKDSLGWIERSFSSQDTHLDILHVR